MRIFTGLIALWIAGAAVPAAGKTYVDTKQRFSVDLPAGWNLTPMPGDRTGMAFKKEKAGAFALLRVTVRPMRAGETLDRSLDEATQQFKDEIGYTPLGDNPAQLGLFLAKRRSLSVYASGDKNTVRSVELVAMHAFGHVHIVHFEARDQDRKRFTKDFDRVTGSYEPKAGLALYAPLVGRWASLNGGPEMLLTENNAFTLGPMRGVYDADGGRLNLHVAEGKESYQYVLDDNVMVLESSNLDGPAQYQRQGAARFTAPGKKKKGKTGPVKRTHLVGKWRALDAPSTEPLVLELAQGGSVSFGPMSGRWRYKRGLLTITSTAGKTVTYTVSLLPNRKRMILGGGDLERDLFLERE